MNTAYVQVTMSFGPHYGQIAVRVVGPHFTNRFVTDSLKSSLQQNASHAMPHMIGTST